MMACTRASDGDRASLIASTPLLLHTPDQTGLQSDRQRALPIERVRIAKERADTPAWPVKSRFWSDEEYRGPGLSRRSRTTSGHAPGAVGRLPRGRLGCRRSHPGAPARPNAHVNARHPGGQPPERTPRLLRPRDCRSHEPAGARPALHDRAEASPSPERSDRWRQRIRSALKALRWTRVSASCVHTD
jgi:hypothetical protein